MNQLSIGATAIAAKPKFKEGDLVRCFPSAMHFAFNWEYLGIIKSATYSSGKFISSTVSIQSVRSEKEVLVIVPREDWLRHRY